MIGHRMKKMVHLFSLFFFSLNEYLLIKTQAAPPRQVVLNLCYALEMPAELSRKKQPFPIQVSFSLAYKNTLRWLGCVHMQESVFLLHELPQNPSGSPPWAVWCVGWFIIENGCIPPPQGGPEIKYLLQGGMSRKGCLLAKPSGPLDTSLAWRTLF